MPAAPPAVQMASAWPQAPVNVDPGPAGRGAAAGTALSGAQRARSTARRRRARRPMARRIRPPFQPPCRRPVSPIAVIFFQDSLVGSLDRAMSVLKDVALIQQQQGGRIRLVGHASERTAAVAMGEHDAINQKMSIARANSVARALIGFGAPQGTISVSAVGAQQPVYYEFMPTGEAGNRRVEVFLYR